MGRAFRIPFALLAVLSSMASVAPAAAEDNVILAPSSEWRFREYDDRCRASRTFGEGENRTSLWIEQGGAESIYNLTLIGQPLRDPYGPAVRLRFGENEEITRSYIFAKSSRGRPVLRMYGVTTTQPDLDRKKDSKAPDISIDQDAMAMIDRLHLRNSIRNPLTLELGPMTAPLSFLKSCGERLSVLLSEAGRPLTSEARPPKPIESDDWLTASDYPDYLVRAQMQGTLTARLTVGTNGKATGCFVVESNKPQLFDDAVCLGLMKRAQFEPAINTMGEPVASYYFYKISFVMR
jgi:TonB family protein